KPGERSPEDRRAVALYSCLITDLRRAWHAVRVHEAAPSLRPSDDESAARASLAALTTRDRMPLYTRQQIEALLKRSRWAQAALVVFGKENVEKCFAAHRNTPNLAGLSRIYEASDIALAPPQGPEVVQFADVQSEAERTDFAEWTRTLRGIGRMACHGWPVFDDNKVPTYVEDDLFKVSDDLPRLKSSNGLTNAPYEDARFDIFKTNATPKQRDIARSNARQARKLVWLLHGLAPSLPAIIHSEIMAMHYQVELLRNAADEPQFENQRTKLHDLADEMYSAADEEMAKWATLIGTLSVVLRYIKIKALHLDVSFALREACKRLTPEMADRTKPEEKKEYLNAEKELRQLLRDCGYDLHGGQTPRAIMVELLEAFEGKRDAGKTADGIGAKGGSPMNPDLSTFPDNAPSTLFGEDWLKDILARRSLKLRTTKRDGAVRESIDDGISVNGVFGETEQWLWTANRGLRKLGAVLRERNHANARQRGTKRARRGVQK
ncbi:MAG TPA: hypothetical protein VMF58_15525, partial [Rhizomicrobium sp.]|nr:hypothetical protein [Rhizomicrobium sp.]